MADVVLTMESDVAKLIREQDKAIRKQQEMIDKLRQTVREGKRASDQSAQSARQIGQAGQSSILGLEITAQTVSRTISRVSGEVLKALQAIRQEQDKLGEVVKETGPSIGLLSTVATDEVPLSQLRQFGRDVLRQGGATSLSEANDLIFHQQKSDC